MKINVSGLPSRTLSFWWDELIAKLASEDGSIGYDPHNINNDFTPQALDHVSDIGKAVASGAESMRNALYVGEYALSMFNNAARNRYRWAWVARPAKTAFFDAEVEYILHGKDKQSGNMFWTKAQLLITRYAMNYIHVHSDARKLNFARNVAITVTSWWSAGSLVPLTTDMILAAWSIKEALSDVEDLLDGKKVAFIKLAGDWKTNIGVSAENQPKTAEAMKWSYIDYLRVYLLMVPRRTKLARICDLIEINTNYAGRELKVKDLYCEVNGELTMSVNYLFMTQAFMPGWLKTPDNRHVLSASSKRDLF